MRKLLFAFLLFSSISGAQTPNKMGFQTVVRNNLGKLVVNKSIGVRLSILKTTSTGSAVYVETHSKTSNVNGLLNLEVGTGTVSSGTFASIDWAQGPYFLKTELDVNGGTNYSIIGVTEFVSVPYALNSKNADNAVTANSVKTLSNGANLGDMCYWNGTTWVPLNAGAEGQTLTFCGGKPTWTVGGVCPGTISTINCASATNNGTLTATIAANSVTSIISYTGGNGGSHNGQVVTSTGVSGLMATLQTGYFANGTGNLTYTITGTASTSGTASFALIIAGKTCTFNVIVNAISTSGYGSNISDIDGNTYKTAYIGTQQWMTENLKVNKYSDGTVIPNFSDNTQWANATSGTWAYYNNDVANNSKYGKLYNWYVVNPTTNGNKNICPTGWHLPTNAEWTILSDYLGGEIVAGGKMKEVGTINWNSPNQNATNLSLFTALPGGYRWIDGNYDGLGTSGNWWSSSEYDEFQAWGIPLFNSNNTFYLGEGNKKAGVSIRCLKN